MPAWLPPLPCRQCSCHRPLSERPSAAHEPFQRGLPRLWTDHQPEENTGFGSGCGLTSQHNNLWPCTGGCPRLRVPWLDDLRLFFSRLWAKQEHGQVGYHLFSDWQREYGPTKCWRNIPISRSTSLRREHTAVRQRVLDTSCPTGEKAERLPLGVSPTHHQHHLAG